MKSTIPPPFIKYTFFPSCNGLPPVNNFVSPNRGQQGHSCNSARKLGHIVRHKVRSLYGKDRNCRGRTRGQGKSIQEWYQKKWKREWGSSNTWKQCKWSAMFRIEPIAPKPGTAQVTNHHSIGAHSWYQFLGARIARVVM